MNQTELALFLSEAIGVPISSLENMGLRDLCEIAEENGIADEVFSNNPYVYDQVAM